MTILGRMSEEEKKEEELEDSSSTGGAPPCLAVSGPQNSLPRVAARPYTG